MTWNVDDEPQLLTGVAVVERGLVRAVVRHPERARAAGGEPPRVHEVRVGGVIGWNGPVRDEVVLHIELRRRRRRATHRQARRHQPSNHEAANAHNALLALSEYDKAGEATEMPESAAESG